MCPRRSRSTPTPPRAVAPPRTEHFPADGRTTWAYRNEVEHFLDCLATGAPFRSPAEDALEDVRVLEAIYRQHAAAHRQERAA